MDTAEVLSILMVVALMTLLFSGYPVALVLIAVTMTFTVIGIIVGEMNVQMVRAFPLRIYSLLAESLIFSAIPPLIFMGVALAKSGLAEDLFTSVATMMRRVPGGLALAVLLLGILIAPSAGVVGASVGILALAALPNMLAANFDKGFASGAVAAAGTLGIMLPPAVMLFFLADLVGSPLIGMFAGVLLPAGVLVLAYILYFVVEGRRLSSHDGNLATVRTSETIFVIVRKVIPPVALIGVVLASMIAGWATPSQAGAIGAAGAFLLMLGRRSFSLAQLKDVLVETWHIVAMIFLIIIAANAFSLVFRVFGGGDALAAVLDGMGLGNWAKLFFILTVIFILGFFIDWLEIVLITLPIFLPVIAKLDFAAHVGDAVLVNVWIGVAVALVLQTSFLTPPFGFALFFLKGSAPPGVTMAHVYRGVAPIVVIQLAVLCIVLAYPWLATELAKVAMK
jgi:tripartite ATP-independent transporter DctM subunit